MESKELIKKKSRRARQRGVSVAEYCFAVAVIGVAAIPAVMGVNKEIVCPLVDIVYAINGNKTPNDLPIIKTWINNGRCGPVNPRYDDKDGKDDDGK